MSKRENDRKLSFWIDATVKQRFDAYIEHGLQSMVLRSIFSMIVDLLDEHGKGVLGLILSGNLKLVIPEGANVGSRRSAESGERYDTGRTPGEDPGDS